MERRALFATILLRVFGPKRHEKVMALAGHI
jgi:hypothetical protein